MQSLYSFIIQPKNGRYTNEVEVGDKKLIVNTTMDDHKFVNRVGVVMSVPLIGDTDLSVGDEVIVHHNVFRRFYNMKGKEQNSRSYFKEDLYFCSADQIYMYNNKAFLDRCFVKPLVSNDLLLKTKPNTGILKYGNKKLEKLGIFENDLVSFPNHGKWEFIIGKELLYCMKSKDILLKHEYKGDEKEYNPSWTKSC